MNISSIITRKNNIFITGICLVFACIALFSFKVTKKERIKNSAFMGVWVNKDPKVPGVASGMKVFDENGSFYNLGFEGGQTIITHKGTYKILNADKIQENVINARSNALWDLKGKTFTNTYQLSEDKQRLTMSGVVYSKNGKDSLSWTEKYWKVPIPD